MSLELPTLAAFEALSIPERTAWFRAWVKQQPPEQGYNYWNHNECPLARFGAAIQRVACTAGGNEFTVEDDGGNTKRWVMVGPWQMAATIAEFHTYGDLARALDNITLS